MDRTAGRDCGWRGRAPRSGAHARTGRVIAPCARAGSSIGGLVEAVQKGGQIAVAADCKANHLALDPPVEALRHAIGVGRVGPRLTMLHPEPSAVKQEPPSVSTWVTWKGKPVRASLANATALRSVSSSLTARWTKREARSMATYSDHLRLSPSPVRSLGRCFTSTCTKPRSSSLKLPFGLRGRFAGGKRPRPSGFRLRSTASRLR